MLILCIISFLTAIISETESMKRVRPTIIEKYPFNVVFSINGNPECGGAIIAENHVLTTAVCLEKSKPDKLQAGSTFLRVRNNFYTISKTIIHEKFGKDEKNVTVNDIAILKIDGKFQYSRKIQPVELFNGTSEPKTEAIISGWDRSGKMLESRSPVLDKKECRSPDIGEVYPYEGMQCLSYKDNHGVDCRLPIGSPVTINGLLAGVIREGGNCHNNTFLKIYTEITHYRKWIDEQSQNL